MQHKGGKAFYHIDEGLLHKAVCNFAEAVYERFDGARKNSETIYAAANISKGEEAEVFLVVSLFPKLELLKIPRVRHAPRCIHKEPMEKREREDAAVD